MDYNYNINLNTRGEPQRFAPAAAGSGRSLPPQAKPPPLWWAAA